MSNKSVARKFFETYGKQHDVEGLAPLFAEQSIIYSTSAPGPQDFMTYKQEGYTILAAFPDIDTEVVEQLEDGDKVVSRVRWSGTFSGTFNGMPPTGRTFQAESVAIDTIRDGKIMERFEISDMLGMLQQIGVIPTSEAA